MWEWTLEDYPEYGTKRLRGGSCHLDVPVLLAASYRNLDAFPDVRYGRVGFRCVAPSQDSKK